VDRASADEDVAVVDPPSSSGAHWANRDSDALYRRPSGQAPFRRPPAVNSFSDETAAPEPRAAAFPPAPRAAFPAASPTAAFPPASTEVPEDRGWFDASVKRDDEAKPADAPRPAPPYGPAPPAAPGRASFGFTAGPISPTGRFADVPTSPATAPGSPAGDRPAPEFGEFVVGPSREIRPHRAVRRFPPEPAAPREPPPATRPARRSRTVMIAAIALTAMVLVAGAAAGIMLFSGSDRNLDSVFRLGGGAGERTATAARGGRTAASFELLAATTKVTIKAQDLGGDLYRITSAEGSGTVPTPVLAKNRVQLHLTPQGTGATGRVTVLLSSKVKWTLRLVGGADEQVVDLRGGRLGSVDVLGAARRIELALPTPSGTVPVRITGAVEDLSITAPADTPIRVRLDSGAKTVAAGQRTLRDLEPGSTLTPQGWQTRNRYDVHAESRIPLLSVT
jgi:hypothetical protein